MKREKIFALLLALVAFRLEAVTRCEGTSRKILDVASAETFQLPVTPVSGALDYEIQRAANWTILPRDIWLLKGETMSTTIRPATGEAPAVRDQLFNSDPELTFGVYYVVTATNSFNSSFQPCAQDFFVNVAPDPSLSRDATRIVVPVAGSLRGANNSVFRTRVVLQNVWDVRIEGTFVFRRTQAGAQSQLRYSLTPKSSTEYQDIVAAIGAEGLGSLDIVPDRTSFGYLAPLVTAQLDSLTAGGSFGTQIATVSIDDPEFGAVWSSFQHPTFLIGDTTGTRYNLGVRTLGDEVTITAILRGADGTQKNVMERSYPADYHQQTPLTTFLGTSVSPGDSVEFFAIRKSTLLGGAIVYLASTDNSTNDVRLDIPRPAATALRQPIAMCSSGEGCGLLSGF